MTGINSAFHLMKLDTWLVSKGTHFHQLQPQKDNNHCLPELRT